MIIVANSVAYLGLFKYLSILIQSGIINNIGVCKWNNCRKPELLQGSQETIKSTSFVFTEFIVIAIKCVYLSRSQNNKSMN